MTEKKSVKKNNKKHAVKCPVCGLDEFFIEEVIFGEWIKNTETRKESKMYTCLHEKCGHSWIV